MARHTASAPILINDLVGVAIARMMVNQLCEMTATRKCENLYWSLALLPDPLIDLRPALDFEGESIYLLCPQLRDAATAQRSEGQWQADLTGLLKAMEMLEPLTKIQTNNAAASKLLEFAALTTVMAPRAKAVLRNDGWSDEKIDSMSPAQLIVVGTAVGYAHYRDEVYKWQSIPFGPGDAGRAAAERLLQAETRQQEVVPLAGLLLPAISKVQHTNVRLQRSIAALRIVEALRCYAANHQNKLPEHLEDVADLPIPVDPQTGQPFSYTLTNGRATLAGPPQPGNLTSESALRFNISVAE